jgi:hypothetical protein
MIEKNRIKAIEKAIAGVLESHLPELQKELSKHIHESVPAAESSTEAGGAGAAELLKAVSAIYAGTTQKEILRALLDGTAPFSGRAALFVVKSGTAKGWQARGFQNSDGVKDFSLDVESATVAQAFEQRNVVSGRPAEMDPKFTEQFGAPVNEKILVLPLLLKDKVAALIYADAGTTTDGAFDESALELLVKTTGTWLEVASLRKQAGKESPAESESHSAVPVAVKSPAYSDPFAGHAPKHVMAAEASAEAMTTEAVTASEVVVESATSSSAAAAAAPALDPFANMSPEDADVHRKAQRFARLLIDEVKLYNQAKVSEGRKKKDLYDRLKEDIEKSRSTFNKRYGNTVAASGDYLNHEIVRSLAGDDPSVMGSNFHQ